MIEVPSTRCYNSLTESYETYLQKENLSKNEFEILINELNNVPIDNDQLILHIQKQIKNCNLKFSFEDVDKLAKRIVAEKNKKDEEKELTEQNLLLLKNPQILEIINREFDKKIVGEEDNRKTIFLNACGKWVKNASIASYNLCINSNSGAGKDFITKGVIKILHSEDVVIRSRISPTAFTYWHNSKFEPNWNWDNKICLLSDVSDNILNHEVFKLMCSDGTHSTIVIKQQAVDIEIKGKPVMFITSASANANNEMLRRFPYLELNETINQTKSIKKKQAEFAAKGQTLEYNPLITDSLSKLKRVNVKIPFAEELVDFFPDDHIIMRTHFQRLLDYIKASAALHQYQRQVDGDGFVIATTEDYDNATIPLKTTTSNHFMIPLSKKQKMLLEECRVLQDFSVRELEPHVPFLVQSKIYDALAKMQELGFLKSYSLDNETSKKPVRRYTYVDFEMNNIPQWKEICCRKKGNDGEGERGIIEGNKGIDNNSLNSTPQPQIQVYDVDFEKSGVREAF